MNHMRRKNTIVSPQTAQKMLESSFGIDRVINTPAGTMYDKNGAWNGSQAEREQCVASFFPEGIEAVLFVNSPIGTQDYSLRDVVKDAYLGSLSV
jgi:hypothetical protein